MATLISPTLTEKIYERTLHYFQALSKIPRSSGKEYKVADYLIAFAKEHGFSYRRTDDIVNQRQTCNVIIQKAGTPGYEDLDILIFQSHIDMVCQKASHSEHNFEKDPIQLQINGNLMTAIDTTLGADDGIGVAMTLAFLESTEISHPPLEALFTSDEEDGMSGVQAIKGDLLKGRRLINIDSEDEGVFTYGCAGGINVNIALPVAYENRNEEDSLLDVEISGLIGGHSGVEIHKGRANAHLLLARTLNEIQNICKFRLVSICGGNKGNVITRAASATITIPKANQAQIMYLAEQSQTVFRHEYKGVETDIRVIIKENTATPTRVLSAITTEKFLLCLLTVPNDVFAMHSQVQGLVGTSCNLGVIAQMEDVLEIHSHIRSFSRTKKMYVVEIFKSLAKLLGATFTTDHDYPDWAPNLKSDLIHRFQLAYESSFSDKKPQFESIHAGLECGFISMNYPDMDMISCGPTVTGAHTTEETLYLDATKRTVALLLHLLTQMKE
ncbi:MAG: beta-Ala-His dipeptidase [Lachnospiraceae bacterium]|nr:beta-Ala-His dipeptidase [Lachnospiraceae bacterium]